MSATYFKSTFYSNLGTQWQINIKAKTLTAGNDTEFKLTKKGFSLKYDKGADIKLAEVKSGSLSFGFIVENETDKNELNTILETAEGEFYIEVKKASAVWWCGWVKPAYNNFNDGAFPYIASVKATDSLGRLLNKYNNAISTSGADDFKDLYNPLKVFFDTFDIASLPIDTAQVVALFKYWAANLPYSTSTNALRKIFYNRNTFVDDPVNYNGVINNYLEELKGVLKSFSLKLMFSNNRYYLIQDTGYDVDAPYVWWSTSPDPSATEFRSNTISEVHPLTIDNTLALSGTNGIMKGGAQFSFEPELNSVRGRYKKGNTFATFDTSNTYSSLSTIGFVSQGLTMINLNLNVQIQEKWAAAAVTPHVNQGSYITALLTCKMKVGNKYLSSNGIYNSSSTIGWEWNTDSASTFSFAVGLGSTANAAVENWTIDNLGFVTSYQEDTPTGFDTATANLIVANLALPELDVYGELQFSMNGGLIYWQLPSASVVYSPDDYLINILADLATNQMQASTGLNQSNTPASSTIELLSSPLVPNIEEGQINDPENNNGTYYFSSVNPTTPNIDKNLGDFALGNNAAADSTETTIRLYDTTNSIYITPGGFDIDTGTDYKDLTQLILNEYMSVSNKPTTKIQGALIHTNYLPTRPIKYKDKIGGSFERFIFIEGTFTAANDEWKGTWYKQDKSTDTFTEDEDPTLPAPNDDSPSSEIVGGNTGSGLAQQNINAANNIATLTTAIAADTAITSLAVSSLKCSLKDGQDIFIMDVGSQNGMRITTTNKATKGASTIDTSFTSVVGYAIGSKIMIAPYDIPNHYNPNLVPGVTETEIYLSPDNFITPSTSNFTMYSRDNLGSIQQSSYARGNKAFASTFIPKGYKITQVLVSCNQNRVVEVLRCTTLNDTTTTIYSGTANTPIPFGTPYVSVLGEYIILELNFGASTDEIYGAKITIAAV